MGDQTRAQKDRLDITRKVLDDDSLLMTYFPKLGESEGEQHRYGKWKTLIGDDEEKMKIKLRKKKNAKTKTKRKKKAKDCGCK